MAAPAQADDNSQTSDSTPQLATVGISTMTGPRAPAAHQTLGSESLIVSTATTPTASQMHLVQTLAPATAAVTSTRPNKTETDSRTWAGLNRLIVISKSAAELALLGPAVDAFKACVDFWEEAVEKSEDYNVLRASVDGLCSTIADTYSGAAPPTMGPTIRNLVKALNHETERIDNQRTKSPLGYIAARQNIGEVLRCYKRVQSLVQQIYLNMHAQSLMLLEEQDINNRIEKLLPCHAARYNSSEAEAYGSETEFRGKCALNTRLEVLEKFRVWRDDAQGEKIFWLNGMAGTGKTTVSYSLCQQLESETRLAANFFCSRLLSNCHRVELIIPTLAYQFASFSPTFRRALSELLKSHPTAATGPISEQLSKLLIEPLHVVRATIPDNLIIVIEALDECSNSRGVRTILDTLLGNSSDLPIRFFLTSRPEPVIYNRMLERTGARERYELHLHELDRGMVQADIEQYLRVGLRQGKVSEADIQRLTERSGVLFIYAATVVRYISAKGFSLCKPRLQSVLNITSAPGTNNNKDMEINGLYTLILEAASSGLDQDEVECMRLVLHLTICAQEPLTELGMALMIEYDIELVRSNVNLLRSVLNVQKDNGITTLHKSFSDYLFDRNRSGDRFFCNPPLVHVQIARRCFDLMKMPEVPFNYAG
ncbi:WD repeat-containing protein [Ceratobasidium sp. AG-Ba]|nr:WD repeat-containing protein [Ceratobasidium sp. AG-Ba]